MMVFIAPEEIRETGDATKYHQVYAQLKKELFFGDYASGDRFFTVRELVDKYALSMNTIRTAIGLLERDGFVSNRSTSGLYVNDVGKRKPGVLIGNVWFCQLGRENNHPYYNVMLTALQARANAQGLNVIVNRGCDVASFPNWFQPESGDGLVVTGELSSAFIEILQSYKRIRYVIVGNYDLPAGTPNVRHNVRESVCQAVSLAASVGKRRIGIIAGPKRRLVTREMVKGVEDAVRDGVIQLVGGVYAFPENGYSGMAELNNAALDCVLVTSPAYFGLCRYVFENGIKYPDEIFVIRYGISQGDDPDNDIQSLDIMSSNPTGPANAALEILFKDGPRRVELATDPVVVTRNFPAPNPNDK